jgi:hypothetical protein
MKLLFSASLVNRLTWKRCPHPCSAFWLARRHLSTSDDTSHSHSIITIFKYCHNYFAQHEIGIGFPFSLLFYVNWFDYACELFWGLAWSTELLLLLRLCLWVKARSLGWYIYHVTFAMLMTFHAKFVSGSCINLLLMFLHRPFFPRRGLNVLFVRALLPRLRWRN